MFKLPVVKILSRCVNKITITFLLILVQLVWMASLYLRLTEYAAWLNGVMTALSVLIILFLVRKDENPAYTIAWMALLGITPVFGGLMYVVGGQEPPRRRRRRRRAAGDRRPRALTRQPPGQREEVAPRPRALGGYIARYGPGPAWKDTAVEYFSSGEAMFPRLLEDLRRAKKFIFLETFIIRPGRMWNAVEDILREKAAAGVDVRVIYDDMGCLTPVPSGLVIRLEQALIRCIPFNPVVPLVSLVMNHRDHRKIVSIDGNVAYNGGTNFADEYINVEERFGYWKDAAVRLEGAAVWNFTVMFLNFWNSFRPMEEDYRPFRPTVQAAADGVVQPYSDSPLDEERLAESVYRDILDQAQDYVYIFTPYLAIGEDLLNSLKLAAKRGVDVRLVLPGIPDKKIVFRLSRSYYLPLLRAGVKVYEFTPGFIHSKCYVSDDRIAVVGSINMDYRSLYLHFECGTLLMGGSQVAAVRADAEQTFGQCHRITLDDCRTSLLGTLLDDVLRLVSPLL